MEKNKKQALILSIVAVVTLIALVVGATYAYFKAQGGTGSSTEVKVTTYTTDMLTFTTGSAISLYADQSSFGQEKGSLSGETFAKATLVANNKTNEATDNYYVYFNIENNTFKYTLGEDKPELILTVTGPDGNEVMELPGLTHKVVQDRENKSISGFDVTTTNGLITIANKKIITATPNAEEQYTLKLTFVNYEGDQTENATSTLSAKVMIQKEPIVTTLASYITNLYTGTQGENSIYYHDANLTNGAGDNSYRYVGGDYVLTETGKATGATMMIGYNNTVTTALIDFYCNGTKQYVGYTCNASQAHYYLIKGDTTHYQTYKETLNKAVEKGYLTKDNVKNFVCFGSNTSPCPTENLYRIIGVFNNQVGEDKTEQRVKLIKADYATTALLGTDGDYSKMYTANNWDNSYYKGNNLANIAGYSWNYKNDTSINRGEGSNTWSTSLLNKTNLNKNFITNIGAEWAAKIAETTWKVGGNTWSNIGTQPAKTAYQNEIVSPVTTNTTDNATDYSAKVGLMYVSDYMYAAPQDKWTLVGNGSTSKDYRAATSVNWMYMGLMEWTISRRAGGASRVFRVPYTGSVDLSLANFALALRPVFSLTSSVNYVSGSGTAADPIVIN